MSRRKTIAHPLDPWWHLGDPRLLLALLLLILGLGLTVGAGRNLGDRHAGHSG